MKIKLTSISIILASLCIVSCRETEELSSSSSNKNQSIISSRIKKDTVSSFTDGTEKPPIKGTNWKMGN